MAIATVHRWHLATFVVIVLCCSVGETLSIGADRAFGCSSETELIRHEESYALQLPDCRAYEQASPVDKNSADTLGRPYLVQSAHAKEGGEAKVTFFSLLPFPGILGAAEFPTYLSSRGSRDWATQGLLPPSNPGTPTEVEGLTEDLDYTVVTVGWEGPLLGEDSIQGEEGVTTHALLGQRNTYIYNNNTEGYRLLAPGEARFVDSSRNDANILFEDKEKLTEKAEAFPSTPGTNLYEWTNGIVTLVGVLPDSSTPEGGSVAGPGGEAIAESEPGDEGNELPGGATSGGIERFYTQNTISEDGTRIFFTDVGTGRIYMREPEAHRTVEVSSQSGYWRASTPDGSYAFYTEGKGDERKLFRFDASTTQKEEITPGSSPHVLGTLGISASGGSVFFVAEGVLPGKLATNLNPENGAANLYEWRSGETTFVGKLSLTKDINDWTDFGLGTGGAELGAKSSRVTPAGTTVLFSSYEKMTGYNNKGLDQLYLYDSAPSEASKNLVCVSCNPNTTFASRNAFLASHFATFAPVPRSAFMTHNLSDGGTRVFFQTAEALLPNLNSTKEMNVYEWEKEGSGSCKLGSGDQSGGCIYLISTGRSPSESFFGDASADGSDVFFFTQQSLAAQDLDSNVDVYDAREEGGIAAQNSLAGVPCSSEACRGPAPNGPAFGSPSSNLLIGDGNLSQNKNLNRQSSANPKSRRRSKRKKVGAKKKSKRHLHEDPHRHRRKS